MSSQNIQSFCVPSSDFDLSADTFVYIKIGGFQGWSFDLDLVSTAASGTLKVYTQNNFPFPVDPFVSEPVIDLPISGGTFAGGETRMTFDNNNGTNENFVVLRWTGTDTSNGTISIVGIINVF